MPWKARRYEYSFKLRMSEREALASGARDEDEPTPLERWEESHPDLARKHRKARRFVRFTLTSGEVLQDFKLDILDFYVKDITGQHARGRKLKRSPVVAMTVVYFEKIKPRSKARAKSKARASKGKTTRRKKRKG